MPSGPLFSSLTPLETAALELYTARLLERIRLMLAIGVPKLPIADHEPTMREMADSSFTARAPSNEMILVNGRWSGRGIATLTIAAVAGHWLAEAFRRKDAHVVMPDLSYKNPRLESVQGGGGSFNSIWISEEVLRVNEVFGGPRHRPVTYYRLRDLRGG